MVFLDEGNGITLVIGVVTGVEGQTDQRWVRIIEEFLDLVLVLNVRVGVRMEDQAQAILLRHKPGDGMGCLNQSLP